jgi:hypothetical protein
MKRKGEGQVPMKMQVYFIKKSLHNRHRLGIFTVILCVLLLALLAFPFTVNAQTDTQLAATYGPVLHFTNGEQFYPTTVEYIIGSSVLKQRSSSGVSSTIIDAAPLPENLGTYTSPDLFLDNKLQNFEQISADYAAKASSLGYHAYVHIVQKGSSTVIQYWLFYIYNNGPLNDHQSDIEVVQVFLDSAGNPQQLLLSQHGAGQNAVWGDVEKVDGHPVVYVAQGSHANYFRSYQGKMGIESDVVGNNGKTIMPAELNLILLGESGNHPDSQSWLDFPGRWGYWGSEQEAALGQAGPYGPVFNQDGIRWAQPDAYLSQTFQVGGTYFILAFLVANFFLFFIIYIAVRTAWKGWGIVKLKRKGGLLVGKFLKGRGSIGLILGVAAILVTFVALFLPWYTITASSQVGPLSREGGATLMNIDGAHGLSVNMFMGTGGSDSTSGFTSLFSTQMPFAIIFGAGIILLALDVVGVKSGKSLGKKLIIGIIGALLPIIIILLFISQLSSLVPLAQGLFPSQNIPAEIQRTMNAVAASPLQGKTSELFPIVGTTTVTWGLGIGAYLFVVAAVLRLIGGVIMYTAPELKEKLPPPPPPMPVQTFTA